MNCPGTIGGVFKARCRELICGDQGTALAITIAFVMPVYLLVLGIYGVSEIVRNKIELQNAADAAAYSAAVVQADYISRLATVNKAMAWTYVDLQKRSLDWAMDAFSKFVFMKFQQDVNRCRQENLPCHMHVPGMHYNCGTDVVVENIVLRLLGTGVGLPLLATEFNGQGMVERFLLTQMVHNAIAEFSGKGSVTNGPKVYKYSYAIANMMKKIAELKKEYPEKIRQTALQMVKANLPSELEDYFVRIDVGDPQVCFSSIPVGKDDEATFISFADPTLKSFEPGKVFGAGTDSWIVRAKIPGFWRIYRQTKSHLQAKWDWFWTRWVHVSLGEIQLHCPPITPGGGIGHGHTTFRGKDSSYFPMIKEKLPIGLLVMPAEPVTVTHFFFGKRGTITVALVRKSPNPLARFSSGSNAMTAPGIWSCFNPSAAGGHRPEYLCAIATARAGYINHNVEKMTNNSQYRLDYSHEASAGKAWNLIETDWDALLVPVKYGWSLCAEHLFTIDEGNILKDIMLDKSQWLNAQGEKVPEEQLPDWANLAPPGGLIANQGAQGQLQWDKLRNYLGH